MGSTPKRRDAEIPGEAAGRGPEPGGVNSRPFAGGSAGFDYMSDDVRIADFLSVRISRLARSVDRMSRKILAEEFDISLVQWRCLGLLCERGPMTGQAISEINDNDNSQTSRALRGLSERGLVAWEGGSDKRAAGAAHATEEGFVFFDRIARRMRARHRWLLQAVEPEEWATVYDLLDRLKTYVDAGWEDAAKPQDQEP